MYLTQNINKLKVVSQPVQKTVGLKIGKQMIEFIEAYNKTHKLQGVGLSAIQVGLAKRVFIMNDDGWKIFVNPEIVDASFDNFDIEEMCLSLPGQSVTVRRPVFVKVKADNMPIIHYDYRNSAIFCHELDHLNGVTILDYRNRDELAFTAKYINCPTEKPEK